MTAASDQTKTNADLSAGGAKASTGVCVSVDLVTGLASINIGGGVQALPMVGIIPSPGWNVVVGYFGGQTVCLGPVARTPYGTIQASPSGGKVKILMDDGEKYNLSYLTGLTLASSDRVIVDWASQQILGHPTSVPADGEAHGPGGGASGSQKLDFLAIDSGSAPNGTDSYFTSEVRCGDSNIGCFFYGTQIADSIPDSATITRVSLYIDVISAFGSAPTVGTHDLPYKSGIPTVTGSTSVGSSSDFYDLPTSYGDDLKIGTQFGLATNHGGNHVWSPAGVNNSGRLVIEYTI